MLYPLWDIGLKIGYSVRDLDDCVKVANTDMQSKTSLIESRLIAGNEALFAKFQKAVIQKCVIGFEDKIHRRAAGRPGHAPHQARQLRVHAGAEHQERLRRPSRFPELLWMAFFKYRTRSLRDLQAQEFVSEAERKQLEAAYEFLLRVRTEMHYNTSRPQDVLGKNLQPAVATNLGYAIRSPSRRIEKFMRDLYLGKWTQHAELDFSKFKTQGRYMLRVGEASSPAFAIDDKVYEPLPDQPLEFMREQQCGYNPGWASPVTPTTPEPLTVPCPSGPNWIAPAAGTTRRIC